MDWSLLLSEKRIRTSQRSQDARSAFESDAGRIIFSPAVRRMHAKTQVFPLTEDDNIHSRLTHSLEVMSVGHTFSILFCESPLFQSKTKKNQYELFREVSTLLENSCLIHDIGNPPFGHFGETVIQEYFQKFFKQPQPPVHLSPDQQREFLHFDGNAQGLRVLTKLQYLNDCYGLNLTCTTLAACLKYPNCGPIDKQYIETKKVGVYLSDKAHLDAIVDTCGLRINGRICRHPLCYLVEASDTICYLTMDLEDGFKKGLYSLEELRQVIVGDCSEIQSIFDKDEPDTTKITKIRNELITFFVQKAYHEFETHIEQIEQGTYNQELIFTATPLAKQLQKFCIEKIFSIPAIYRLELLGHSVLTGLLDMYIDFLFHPNKNYRKRMLKLLSESIVCVALKEENVDNFDALSDYYKLRVIVDCIAGMTDRYALNMYHELQTK